MAIVSMPQLGETVTEGTVGRWLKKQGDAVAKYEPLLEVETDKVASEIPSPFAGTLSKILVEEGTTVPVGAPVCEIGEAAAASKPSEVQPSETAAAPANRVPLATPSQSASDRASRAAPEDGVRYSPAVRKLAREHHIDLRSLPGSGRGGRLTAQDVQRALDSGSAGAARVPSPGTAAAPQRVPISAPQPVPIAPPADGDTVVRVSQMRKTIAERMVLSKTTIPHAWSMVEADVSDVV
ncbi:MAG: E3 binding domain-containing protein, partial [Candidatus Eremiobacteraeota bacterium]|nr:E3 binding domain-containing protein [Candidatus Eremiobacteraeota bacterium]